MSSLSEYWNTVVFGLDVWKWLTLAPFIMIGARLLWRLGVWVFHATPDGERAKPNTDGVKKLSRKEKREREERKAEAEKAFESMPSVYVKKRKPKDKVSIAFAKETELGSVADHQGWPVVPVSGGDMLTFDGSSSNWVHETTVGAPTTGTRLDPSLTRDEAVEMMVKGPTPAQFDQIRKQFGERVYTKDGSIVDVELPKWLLDRVEEANAKCIPPTPLKSESAASVMAGIAKAAREFGSFGATAEETRKAFDALRKPTRHLR